MVKHSLFSVPVLGWWLNAVDMFPVKGNESDNDSFKWALSLLKKGGVVFMTPEGTRKYDPGNPPRVVRLAQEADCPVCSNKLLRGLEKFCRREQNPLDLLRYRKCRQEIRFKK